LVGISEGQDLGRQQTGSFEFEAKRSLKRIGKRKRLIHSCRAASSFVRSISTLICSRASASHKPSIVPGTTKPHRLEENLASADLELTDADLVV